MSGQITPVEIVGRRAVSTEGMIMQSKVLLGRPFAAAMFDPSATPPVEMESDEQVVAALITRPSAVGFLRFPPGGQPDNRIRVVGIIPAQGAKAVFPTAAAVADGSYPLTDSLTLYLQPAAPPSAREFCKFAAGPDGAKIVKQCGLWPEYELNEVRGAHRLKDVKAHRGVEVAVCGSPAVCFQLSPVACVVLSGF
jgi:ABC-type phosphate transport system substrate-binding protein